MTSAPMTPGWGPATEAAGPDGVLAQYWLGPEYRRPVLVRFVLYAVVTVLLALAGWQVGKVAWVLGSVMAVLACGYGTTYLVRGRFRTVVTGQGIVVRGYRTRRLPWSEVCRVEVSNYTRAGLQPIAVSRRGLGLGAMGTGVPSGRAARLATIRVVTSSRRKVLLRAPLVTAWASDPYFSDKARELARLVSQYGTGASR
jgi:hypothetical protein